MWHHCPVCIVNTPGHQGVGDPSPWTPWWRVTKNECWIFNFVITKDEIIRTLATTQRVEQLVMNITHHELTADLKDLCQIVYLVLLEYDETKLQDLWEHNEMDFFLARVIINQYRSSNSPFHYQIRKFRERSVSMGVGADINDAAIEKINRNYVPRRDK